MKKQPSSLIKYFKYFRTFSQSSITHRLVTATDRSSSSMLFVSDLAIEYFQMRSITVGIDCSYQIVQKNGCPYHLLSVNVLMNSGVAYPLMFAFMEQKSPTAYDSVLAEIQAICTDETITIEAIICDYDSTIRTCIGTYFPTTKLSDNCFYFARTIYERCKELGVTYHLTPAKKVGISMAMALPLLPTKFFFIGVDKIKGCGVVRNYTN